MVDFHLSILGAPRSGATADTEFTTLLTEALPASLHEDRWEVHDTDPLWCSVHPVPGSDDQKPPGQGWKLHVSATPVSAPEVLRRALPVLLAEGSAFKFARDRAQVAQLNARHTPRGHSGKFLTVYPQDDEAAVRLAARLDEVTDGLAGPRVLSDRPYRAGSLVHYRYGAFVEERRISNDGMVSWVIFDPDGNPVEDRRIGQYLPPDWVRCPFPDNGMGSAAADGGGLLVGKRFLVQQAVRQTNRGGVYQAVDTRTGEATILKEARPHVAVDETGGDTRDLLRAEFRALEVLAPHGIAPAPLALFDQGGHLFLAEQLVPGTSLREWVLDRIRAGGWQRSIPEALDTAAHVVALLDAAHQAGLILRDLTPNNIMVRPDGQLRLIDLELAVPVGDQIGAVLGVGTPGFAAPEQLDGAAPAVPADLYSLGACLSFLVTGSTPDLLDEDPPARPVQDRLAEWLAVRSDPTLPVSVPEIIRSLLDPDPERRPGVAAAARAIAAARPTDPAPVAPAARATPATAPVIPATTPERSLPADTDGGTGRWGEAITGLVSYLRDTMGPPDADRLWPVSCVHGAPDPGIVQLGAAGVLGPLTRYVALTGDPRARETVAAAARWLRLRSGPDVQRAPGLYFGSAGIAWALYEAGRLLDDDGLTRHALDLAATLPTDPPTPDITHGTAGIGFALLHLGRRAGRPDLIDRAGACADTLVATAPTGAARTGVPSSAAGDVANRRATDDEDVLWGTPAAFDSRLAGGRFYGFAHGTAGIGAFLLATGRPDAVHLAHRAARTLHARAVTSGGLAQWGAGPGDPPTAPYWCHGASGIGTFLTRLHRASGDGRSAELAVLAGNAVLANSSRGVLGQCHGLAGNGEFLLDLAETTDRTVYRGLAARLARVILASGARRGESLVFPDEAGGVSATWADGAAGILSFLLRLRYGGPRPWTVEQAGSELHTPGSAPVAEAGAGLAAGKPG